MRQNWIPFFTFFLRRILSALPAADIVEGVGYLGCDELNVAAVANCSAGVAAERVTECRTGELLRPARVAEVKERRSGGGGEGGGGVEGGIGMAEQAGKVERGSSLNSGTWSASASRKGASTLGPLL